MTEKQFDNENRGALSRNDRKEDENDRDYSGSLNVGGTDYWISGWLKTSKAGQKFLSLSVKPKDAPAAAKSKPKAKAEFNDEIGF